MSRSRQHLETEEGNTRPASAAADSVGGKILLVDDDQDLVETLGLRLRLAGFTPVAAYGPSAALARFETERPDLVLLDVDLGVSSGLEVLEALRKRSQVPILMLTGHASDSVEARSFELGADDYLQKPISAHALIARIRSSLSRCQRAQEQGGLNVALSELVDARDQALAEARRSARALDESLALAAHDLLQPLTVIKSVAQFSRARSVRPGTPDDDPLVQALTQIEAKVTKMARQLIQLLSGTGLDIEQVVKLRRARAASNGAHRQAFEEPKQSLAPHSADLGAAGRGPRHARPRTAQMEPPETCLGQPWRTPRDRADDGNTAR